MRKLISILLVLVMLICALSACEGSTFPNGNGEGGEQGGTNDTQKPDGGDPDANKPEDSETDVYEKLNALMDAGVYSKLTVTTSVASKSGVTLSAEYVYTLAGTGTVINYSVEKLGQFEIVDGVYTAPDSMVETLVGYVIVSDGEIVKQSGDAVEIDFANAKYPHFEFEEYYFTAVTETEGEFSARVTSPSRFLGTTIICSGMSVSLKYNDTTITDVTVAYTSEDGAQVTMTYTYK